MVDIRWNQLDLFTDSDTGEVEIKRCCGECGWPVDSLKGSDPSSSLLQRCSEPGCPHSTAPTTTPRDV